MRFFGFGSFYSGETISMHSFLCTSGFMGRSQQDSPRGEFKRSRPIGSANRVKDEENELSLSEGDAYAFAIVAARQSRDQSEDKATTSDGETT